MATNIYNHSKVYKIISSNTDLIYIGATTKTLAQRLSGHKCSYKRYLNHQPTRRITSFKLLELGGCEIFLLESVNCNNKDELRSKEREWIDKFKSICVNLERPTITQEERVAYKNQWYEENKDRMKEHSKQNIEHIKIQRNKYRDTHKEQIRQKFTCICGSSFTNGTKARHERTAKHQAFLKSKNIQPSRIPSLI